MRMYKPWIGCFCVWISLTACAAPEPSVDAGPQPTATDAGSQQREIDAGMEPHIMSQLEHDAGARTEIAEDAAKAPAKEAPSQPAKMAAPVSTATPTTSTMPVTAAADASEAWPEDCKERFVFRAHGHPGDADPSKYALASGDERVVTFYFDAPWTIDAVQLLKNKERIDNPKIVHHWMLYLVDNSEHKDGEILDDHNNVSFNTLLDQQSVLGGIPGSGDITMPDGVGLHLPTGKKLTYALSIHYFNATEITQTDASGVEICVTDAKRAADASTHWVGKLSFNLPARAQTDVVATCRPKEPMPEAHIISSTPHMHKLGRHATLQIARANGEAVTLLDTPYDFNEQRVYDITKNRDAADLVLKPGDQIRAKCSFDNTNDTVVGYGEGSMDEMCFISVLAWPAGSLSNGLPFASALGLSEDQVCLEP